MTWGLSRDTRANAWKGALGLLAVALVFAWMGDALLAALLLVALTVPVVLAAHRYLSRPGRDLVAGLFGVAAFAVILLTGELTAFVHRPAAPGAGVSGLVLVVAAGGWLAWADTPWTRVEGAPKA